MSTLKDLTPGTWNIDPVHTELAFIARHVMVSRVRGRFGDYEGSVVVADDLEDSKVNVSIKTASVDTRSPDRDAHLRSADFFDAETFPVMTFESTKVGADSLEGNLTIKDQTHPVTFEVEFNGVHADPWGGTRAGFEARTKVSRKEWNLTWNAAIEGGGVVVGDNITIELDVELAKA